MSNLLLIEDDLCTVQLVERIVTRNSYRLFHSYDGQDVMRVLAKHNISLILLDMRLLNGHTGWEVANQLKNSDFRHVPIVALSAPQYVNEPLYAREVGCVAFLPKPYGVRDLLWHIDHFRIH